MEKTSLEFQKALLALDNVVMWDNEDVVAMTENYRSFTELLGKGILLLDENNAPFSGYISARLVEAICDRYEVSNRLNNPFHAAWDKVANADYRQLIVEQALHYLSTYGRESFGLGAAPVVPTESFELPDNQPLPVESLTILRMVDAEVANDIVEHTLTTVAAPHKNDMVFYNTYCENTTLLPEKVKSNELRTLLYTVKNLYPEDEDEFVRYLLYRSIGSTLVIKNKKTIKTIKNAMKDNKIEFFVLAGFQKANLPKLARNFLRLKPIYLAFKTPVTASYINKIRRLADTYHKPMSDLRVANLSNLFYQGENGKAKKVIEKMSMRELIKVRNFTNMNRIYQGSVIEAYNIRNGKIHLEEGKDRTVGFVGADAMDEVLVQELCNRTNHKLAGKIFFIPSYIDYCAPVSEKQFIGNIPYGTKFSFPNTVSLGIFWENYKNERTDLDLHLTTPSNAFGWNGSYRDGKRTVLYSGDMTDATNGAAEAFYANYSKLDEPYILSANNFTGMPDVPFKFICTESRFEASTRTMWGPLATCPIDISKTLFPPIDLKFKDTNSQTIGFGHRNTFYFCGGELNSGIIPDRSKYREYMDALIARTSTSMSLRVLLLMAGARVVTESGYEQLTDEEKARVVDLTPSALTRTTLIDLVDSLDK